MSTSVPPHPDNTRPGVATVRTATPALTVAALGVVFGDLGTSPLYALQEAFHGPGAVVATRENVLGVVSLFVWSLILVISVKYIAFIMRADNRGEGGVLALLALTGARPIRVAWYGLVLPALVLNYLGQAAVLLGAPEAAARPFYAMVPGPLLYPMVALATLATIIASQALISAVFSLTRQAVQLGYWPRVHVVHTSASEEGQIYVPAFNWAVMAATLALVLAFRSSARLASAFGLAVAGTMAITTVLFALVARRRFRWPAAAVGAFVAVFLTIDVVFFAANATKLLDGAWLPLAIGAGLFVLMTVWMRGRSRLRRRYHERAFPLDEFLTSFALGPCVRVPGAAVFLSPNAGATPPALLHYLKHAKSLHEQVVILTVQTEEVPHVTPGERVEVEALTQGFWRVVGRFGFMETPDVPVLLGAARARGLGVQGDVTYFLGRETVVASRAGQRGWWGARLFAAMHRNARPAADFFALPSNQIMEVGAQVDL